MIFIHNPAKNIIHTNGEPLAIPVDIPRINLERINNAPTRNTVFIKGLGMLFLYFTTWEKNITQTAINRTKPTIPIEVRIKK
tara:strand:+ start:964 stop:1209 length:246 start_codon:yes stop_codon:yes gene_type:complete